jgi:hypothetical protein
LKTGRKPWIIDEWTDRTDLNATQKYRRRHPEKVKALKKKNARRDWANRPPEKRAGKALRRKFKITPEDWMKMYDAQSGHCAICNDKITSIHEVYSQSRGVTDHDHKTGKIRKLLCHHCNRALGLVQERIKTLQNMIIYLEAHNE